MSTYSPPYSTFALNGANISVNDQGAHHQDNMRLRIDGDYLTILDGSEAICRGVLADYPGLTGGTLAAKMDYFSTTYTASAGAATLTGPLPDTASGDFAAIATNTSIGHDPVMDIRQGLVSGKSMMVIVGRGEDMTTTFATIAPWPATETQVVDSIGTSNVVLALASTSGNDTAAGSGLRTVLVVGKNTGILSSEIVTLNGTTKVATSGAYNSVDILIGQTAGLTGQNAGTVYVGANSDTFTAGKPDNDIYAVMGVGTNTSRTGIGKIPAGKNGYIHKVLFSAGASKTGTLKLMIREEGKLWQELFVLHSKDGTSEIGAEGSPALPENTEIRLDGKVDAGTGGFTASVVIELKDA